MAAKEEVMTTRWTVGLWAWMALRISVVPWMAGWRRSRSLFATWVWKGEAVWMTFLGGFLADGGWGRKEGAYAVDTFDGFVE